jgi:hypothetical protein
VRNELVRQLRASISALTEDHKHTEHQLDTLIRYEQAIEVIDRAITEEQRAAAGSLETVHLGPEYCMAKRRGAQRMGTRNEHPGNEASSR